MNTRDVEELTDDQLTGLYVAARKELQRRGIQAEAEVWAAALSEPEHDRIAREAAAREAERLRREQERRVAAEAAERVRRAAEAQRQAEAAAQELARAERLRALAAEARVLFGHDQPQFDVKIWAKGADRRLYVGHGYDANWVEYHHTGNARTAPGTLHVVVPRVVSDLAEYRGITPAEAKALVLDYCRRVCEGWQSLALEVNESNAPRDPACRVEHGWVLWDNNGKNPWYLWTSPKAGSLKYSTRKSEADHFATEAEALEAGKAHDKPTWTPVKHVTWRSFPPQPAPAGGGAR